MKNNGYSIYPRHLKIFVKSSIMIDDTLMTKKYFEMLVSKTENDTTVITNNSNLAKVKGFYWWNDFINEYDSLRLFYYSNFDSEYSIVLRNMLYLDQYLRTKYPDSLVKNYNISLYIDNDNFNKLKSLINHKGFPSYSKVGYKGIKAIYLILMHSTTYNKMRFEYIDSVLIAEVKANNFSPWMYANIIDRYYRFEFGYQVYGNFVEKDKQGNNTYGNIMNIEDLDKRRYELGLYSFSDFAKDLKIKSLPKNYRKLDILDYYNDNK